MEDQVVVTKEGAVIVLDSTSNTLQEMVEKMRNRPGNVFVITNSAPTSVSADLFADMAKSLSSEAEVKTVAPYLQKVQRQKRNLRRL